MTNARNVLRDFDLAGPAEREEIIRGLVDRISVGEAECLAKARHKCDMFGHDQMPLEIRLMIIHYLDITDFYNCALLVCRKWKVLLMGSKVLAEDVLHTWFPCLYDKDMPEEDMMELFSQTILKRYLRDTGRFQYRMTCSFATNSNAEHPKSRIEGLQKGHTFKDLTCSAWLHTRTPTLPVASMALDQHFKISYAAVTKESIVTMCLYSDYRLAWQMGGSDPGSSVIYFHNLHEMHTQKPSSFRLSGQLILGLKLKLEALGDYLIVASVVGQRKLYARDLQTHTDDSVILPAALYSCITQGELVLIVTVNGDLLLWTFLRGLVQIDTAARPKNQQAHRGVSEPRSISRPLLMSEEVHRSTCFFHPRDRNVFFVATFNPIAPGWLCVYEFREKLCSRIFTHSFTSPIETITHRSSSWVDLGLYHDERWKPSCAPKFGAKKADAHGTHTLLEFRGRFNGTYRLIYVMFNTLETKFSGRVFEPPRGYDLQFGGPALVWNGQLCLYAKRLGPPNSQAFYSNPLLVLQSLKRVPPRKSWFDVLRGGDQSMIDNQREEQDKRQWRNIQEETFKSTVMQQPARHRMCYQRPGEMPAPIMGIVRYQDISRAYPHAADFVSESGLLYMCSFYGGGCSFNSSHTDCTWYSPAAQSNDVFTPKIRSTRHYGYDSGPGDDEAWKSIEAEAIFGDDEFLILITNRGLYTVFAVDADRGMAKVLKRTQETKRTIWQ